MSEPFFVLAGTVRIYNGTSWVDAAPGDFCFLSEGGVLERFYLEHDNHWLSRRPAPADGRPSR